MPDAREVECAAERWAIHELGAIRTRRALRTKWAKVDFFGSDVLAYTDTFAFALIQASKATGREAEKRRGLERLGGDSDAQLREVWVNPQPDERRIFLKWESRQHPDDGRRTIHEFHIQELVEEQQARECDGLAFDGRSRRPMPGWVWADWVEPFQIPKNEGWYTAPDSPQGGASV